MSLSRLRVIVLSLAFAISFSTLAHEDSSRHQHSPGDHEGHEDIFSELPDDPVYTLPWDLIKDLPHHRTQELIDKKGGGRIFVDRIEGQYLKLAKGQVVLTIDDGPTPNVTPKISRLLNDFGIRGVFFVVGNRVARYPGIMDQLQADGHIIANHTWNHELDFPTQRDLVSSLSRSMEAIEPYMGRDMRCYFRAPGGVWNSWRKDILNNNSYLRQCIGPFWWNIGGGSPQYPADWKCWSSGISPLDCSQGYYRELLQKGRGVILMHDINSKSYSMLRSLLEKMKREGIKNTSGGGFWEFVDLDQATQLDSLED